VKTLSVLIDIRRDFEQALKENRSEVGASVVELLEEILDTAYKQKNRRMAGVLDDLLYCAAHIQMGVFFKASGALPSETDIEAVLPISDN
jgi:hypothetical protein